MADVPSVTLALIGLLAAGLYGYVARLQAKREAHGPARSALRGFVLWWGGLAALGVLTASLTFLPDMARFGLLGVRLIIYPMFLLIFAMCGGLVHYLLYLYTGRSGVAKLAYGFYGGMMGFLIWMVEAHSPHIGPTHEGQANAGEVAFHLHAEPAAWVGATLSLGLLVPLVIGVIAYGMLFFRTDDRTAKYRIAMVSSGFLLWFAWSLLGTVFRLVADVAEQGFVGRLVGQFLGVSAAVLTIWAYRPPRFLRQRFGLRDVVSVVSDGAVV